VSKYALVVMSESGDEHPGGQGRMLHALQAAAEFRSAGVEVCLWFHGIGVEWLAAFEGRSDRYTEVYGPLFDSLRDVVGAPLSSVPSNVSRWNRVRRHSGFPWSAARTSTTRSPTSSPTATRSSCSDRSGTA